MVYSVHRQEAHRVRTTQTLDEKMFLQGREMRAMYARKLDAYPRTLAGRRTAIADTAREYIRLRRPELPETTDGAQRDAVRNERALVATVALQWARTMVDALEVYSEPPASGTVH